MALFLKDQSTVRALPAAKDKWASSFVRGVYKAFKLKLDLEIPRACGSPVTGGEIFQSHMDKVTCCCFLCVMSYSVNFISKIFSNNAIFQFFVIFFSRLKRCSASGPSTPAHLVSFPRQAFCEQDVWKKIFD